MRFLVVVATLFGVSLPLHGRAAPAGPSRASVLARAHFDAGRAALEQGRLPEAIVALKSANELVASPPVYFHLADAFQRSGNYAAAAERLRACLRLWTVGSREERAELEQLIHALETGKGIAVSLGDARAAASFKTFFDVDWQPRAAAPLLREEARQPLYRRWWLWSVVGVAAATLGVGLGVGLMQPLRATPTAPTMLGTVRPF